MGTSGGASFWGGVDTSGEMSVDSELCTSEMPSEVCLLDTGGTVLVVAAAVADMGVAALVVDTWVVVTLVVVTVTDFSEDGDDVVVVTVGAPVDDVTGGEILTVFSGVVGQVVATVCSLEGVVTWTPSVEVDVVTVMAFALAGVVTLAEVVAGA